VAPHEATRTMIYEDSEGERRTSNEPGEDITKKSGLGKLEGSTEYWKRNCLGGVIACLGLLGKKGGTRH